MTIKIDEIRKLIEERRVRWRNHMLKRMKERKIKRTDVFECVFKGEVIEQL